MTNAIAIVSITVRIAAATVPNVDRYVMALRKHCKDLGIDTGGSFAMRAFGA